jgi:hypothetical protein
MATGKQEHNQRPSPCGHILKSAMRVDSAKRKRMTVALDPKTRPKSGSANLSDRLLPRRSDPVNSAPQRQADWRYSDAHLGNTMGFGVLEVAESRRIGEGAIAIADHYLERFFILTDDCQIDETVPIEVRGDQVEYLSLHR